MQLSEYLSEDFRRFFLYLHKSVGNCTTNIFEVHRFTFNQTPQVNNHINPLRCGQKLCRYGKFV